ncbi:AcrR family transcriptional regulator [Bradyrhizobium ottawaense]
MTEQLSADDWIKEGLKALAKSGFTALKADPLAKSMGVSRGSFYWHFADLGAFQATVLKRWREIAAEQIIADVEAAGDDPLKALLRRSFGARLELERAVRNWAAFDAAAQGAVRAIDPPPARLYRGAAGKTRAHPGNRAGPGADPVLDIPRLRPVRRAGAGSTAAVPARRGLDDGLRVDFLS